MKIAVIPARGGSKRIPRKNIKYFCGKPMIAYAITAAKTAAIFDHIVVSTDDLEISKIALSYGAEVPFVRPPELADDYTPTVAVICHAIQKINAIFGEASLICCIYPAVPLIDFLDLSLSLELMLRTKSQSCMPITKFNSAPQRALKKDRDGNIHFMYPDFKMTRSQDLEDVYYDIGQFYWGTIASWANNSVSNGVGYEIPNWRVVDIDNINDWKRAEFIYKNLLNIGFQI